MGKASKKKSARRAGAGPSRAEAESRTRQEQAQRRLAASPQQPRRLEEASPLQLSRLEEALRRAAEVAAAQNTAAQDAVTELWGGAEPVPAEVPRWDEGSLGDFFFTEPLIARAATAPPAGVAVLPSVERMLGDGNLREAVALLLIRAVAFDGRPVAGPEVGAVLTHLGPVIEWEAGHFGREVSDDEADDVVTAPVFVIGSALVEAARVVIAEDRIAPVTEVLGPVLDAALAPFWRPAELTGAAAMRALTCAVAHDYLFDDPADTALLDQLDPDSTTSQNPLETLIADKLLAPAEAPVIGLALLGALAGLCRSNAASVLREV
jgi:hypothetical protein